MAYINGNHIALNANLLIGEGGSYDEGYKDGQKSMIDESKIIEKTASGIGSVTVDDVSEIPHEIKVQLSSDTITDFSGVTLTELNSNKKYAVNADGTVEGVTSLSPNMTLQSNIANVSITMTYHKSWGMQTERDKLWDNIQDKGKRTDYSYFFMNWNGNAFYPKYDFNLADSTLHGAKANVGMFRNFNKGYPKFDFRARLEECDVVLNTSEVQNFQYFLLGANVSRVPTIDLSNAINTYMAVYDTEIEIIDKLIFSENTVINANGFLYNDLLTTITEIEGTIAKSIAFTHSPLNKASILNVFNALSDTSTSQTLILKKSAVDTAFETSSGAADGSESEEWLNLVATKPNWTISLA